MTLAACVLASTLLQPPAAPAVVETPTVKVLTGLTVPEFEAEMQRMTQALGASCGACHSRGDFASEANPRKAVARRMLEMTRTINQRGTSRNSSANRDFSFLLRRRISRMRSFHAPPTCSVPFMVFSFLNLFDVI